MAPFDAVLVVSFGGPNGPADIRPFLANVLRGRRVPPERVEEVVHHYELFGGVSPLTEATLRQARQLEARLAERALPLPVYVGMRNWHPFLADTIKRMSAAGHRRAIGVIMAAHRSYSSCTQYRQNVADARVEAAAAGVADVSVTYVGDWHAHPGFVGANAARVRTALERLPVDVRQRARIVFTAHSVPASMSGAGRYQEQIEESARAVASALGATDWVVVFQSRSGRPQDPWLGPDISEYLRGIGHDVPGVVVAPIGFVCDHIEVLYDLDHEAAAACREIGLPMSRAETVGDHPLFIDALADAVSSTYARYASGRPLAIVSATPPERVEGPPPARVAAAPSPPEAR